MITRAVLAVPESTTPDSPFAFGFPAVTVTSYSPLIGDNGALSQSGAPLSTDTVYNLFGANNSDSVEHADDILFDDPSSANWESSPPINSVDFTTPSPVCLIGVAVYLNSDGGGLDDGRSVGTFTFSADGVQLVDAAPSNEDQNNNGGVNTFMFANMVMASNFVATFSDNPNTVEEPGDTGVGPRVLELDGIPTPEPTFLGVFALGGVGLLSRPRRSLRP